MAVRFEYEWHDARGQWYRAYDNELWESDDDGLMAKRFASINDDRSPNRSDVSPDQRFRRRADAAKRRVAALPHRHAT